MNIDYLNFQSINVKEFVEFILRFAFDFLIIYLVAKVYFKVRKKKDILFALFLLNIVVFIVCYLLQSIQLSIGFAFGIFAIFSILRYRTTTVPIKEMTYVFISISTAIVNALTNITTGYGIMIFSNFTIVVAIYFFERKFAITEQTKTIIYDNLSLITLNQYDDLLEDVKKRTGLNIQKVKVGRINFKSGEVSLKIYY